MEIESGLVKLLMDIGFMASANELTQEAEVIFKALEVLRAESEYPKLGLALVKMNTGQTEEAIDILNNQALGINPENDLIKAYLGLAYTLMGKKEAAREVFDEIITSQRSEEAVQMAHIFLETLNAGH